MFFNATLVKHSEIDLTTMTYSRDAVGSYIIKDGNGTQVTMKNDLVILGLGTKEEEENLHPWLKRYIRRIENNEDKLCDYIRDYVLI